jgi:hypothetical protein
VEAARQHIPPTAKISMSGYEGMTIEAGDKITKGIKKSESSGI